VEIICIFRFGYGLSVFCSVLFTLIYGFGTCNTGLKLLIMGRLGRLGALDCCGLLDCGIR